MGRKPYNRDEALYKKAGLGVAPGSVRAMRKKMLRHMLEHAEDMEEEGEVGGRDRRFIARWKRMFHPAPEQLSGEDWIEAFE